MTVEPTSHSRVKLSVDDFDLLALNGGLAGLERSELLDGDVYPMSPQYTRHGRVKARFYNAVLAWQQANRPDLEVFSEVSVAMPPHDEPMPDVILCDIPRGDKGIVVETVHLLVEVAGDSSARDLGYKAALYARQGVPEYWVADLAKGVVHCFNAQGAEGYAEERKVAFGRRVEAVTLAGLAVETEEENEVN
jgi:Uma2 family endonuclease